MNTETYDALATLLAYPDDRTKVVLERCQSDCASIKGTAESLTHFVEKTAPWSTEDLQELYTQTFDLNPTCTLEIGWQLFGENYSRGEFLVAMRQTLRRLGVMETTELPDHVTLALSALGRMEPAEASRFSAEFLLPALGKMVQALSGKENPYAGVLEAIQAAIRFAHPLAVSDEVRRVSSLSLPLVDPTPEVCHG